MPFLQESFVFGLPGGSVCPYEYDQDRRYQNCQEHQKCSKSRRLWQMKRWCQYSGLDWA